MSRPLRVIKQNVTYHCYSRCIEKRKLIKSDLTKEIILNTIRKALVRYKFNLSYIEFVDNHVHIIIKTLSGGATISEIMQYIKSRITKIYNKIHSRTGTLWNERFKSEIIEDHSNPQDNFIRLIIYLSYNSVRRNMYDNPLHNPYSSLHVYKNQQNDKRIPIHLHEYFTSIGETDIERTEVINSYEKLYLLSMSE
jgi:REP element-mobilizing transposase RayT